MITGNKKNSLNRRWHFSHSPSLLARLVFGGSLLFIYCSEPIDNEIECGDHQIEVNGTCECDEGYHPCGEDSTDCCLDTTSHDFMWEIDTLGGYGSYLKDVAIIDENNVWVVGNIETDSTDYSGAVWNGESWQMIILENEWGIIHPTGIWAFDESDIWIVNGCGIYHWDGDTLTMGWECNWQSGELGVVSTVWGSSPDNIFFVGNDGTIVHYDGASFQRMESATDVDLQDIEGTAEGEYIFALGWEQSGENTVLEYTGDTWYEIYYNELYLPTDNTYGRVSAVSLFGDTAYFATKAGLWKYNFLSQSSTILSSYIVKTYGLDIIDISGDNENDIMMVSLGARILHFNGISWYRNEIITDTFGFQNVYLKGGDIYEDLAVAVGYCCGGNHSIVVRGIR